jgi:phospholipid/cholesterol/gamma-HCH transport system permease protein
MSWVLDIVDDLGRQVMFLKTLGGYARRGRWEGRSVLLQIDKVTMQSLPTVAISGFFVGAILVIQFTVQIKEFGALGYLGGLVTSSTVREVGPLLIAFMLSGKIGAFTTAELGTMRVTEQIDAIRCLGADPLSELVLPRFLGIVIASFFLLSVGVFASILGGLVMASLFSGINPEEYLRHISTLVAPFSIASGLFKCLVFAFMLAAVCTYKGYTAGGGSRGVGRAVVQTAVYTMIGIVVTDWLTTQIAESVLRFWENLVL